MCRAFAWWVVSTKYYCLKLASIILPLPSLILFKETCSTNISSFEPSAQTVTGSIVLLGLVIQWMSLENLVIKENVLLIMTTILLSSIQSYSFLGHGLVLSLPLSLYFVPCSNIYINLDDKTVYYDLLINCTLPKLSTTKGMCSSSFLSAYFDN